MAPGSGLELEVGVTFHAHSWFTNTEVADYFISNTLLLGENEAEVLTPSFTQRRRAFAPPRTAARRRLR